MISRVLIANRGEIALRIIRACREMGIETVAVYSEADKESPYLQLADEAICIGPADPAKATATSPASSARPRSPTSTPSIRATASWPRTRSSPQICQDCGITFIGPSPQAMRLLGDKVQAREPGQAGPGPGRPRLRRGRSRTRSRPSSSPTRSATP